MFCATFFTYNFQRIFRLKIRELLGKQIGIRLSWIVRNRKVLFFSAILAAIICLGLIFTMKKTFILSSIPLAFLAIFYVVPFFKLDGKKVAIRNLPYIKIFIISAVWSIVIVGLPFFNTLDSYILTKEAWILLVSQYLFILAITLPFDVRDLNYDSASKIKTIPSTIGVKKTIFLSLLLLAGFVGLKYYQLYLGQIEVNQFYALTITSILSAIIIAFTSKKRSELFFSGLVEGTMVLMYLGILILEY